MVGVGKSSTSTKDMTGNSNSHFYKLKERGKGVKEIITSRWGSKEDLAESQGSGSGSGSGSGGGRRATSSWSEDEIPLKSIRVKNEVEVDTRDDSGGALSPV